MFLRIAEPAIFRKVRILEMETDATLTFTAAASYADDLPTGFLGFKSIFVPGTNKPEVVYLPPQRFHVEDTVASDAFSTLDADFVYTIEANKVKIKAVAGASEDVTANAVYFARPDGVSDSNSTNDILTNHYDAYLMKVLQVLWDWVDEKEIEAVYKQKFDNIVEEIRENELARRRPAGPLVRRVPNRRVV
jgi:hypothetical protein